MSRMSAPPISDSFRSGRTASLPTELRSDFSEQKRRRVSVCAFLALCFSLVSAGNSLAQQKPPAVTEPKLLSIFSSVGRPGTTVQAEIRGNLNQGSYAIWFDGGRLAGRVLNIKEATEQTTGNANHHEEKPASYATVYRALVEITIPATAHPGTRLLRLVCRNGLSDPVRFRVIDEPLLIEGNEAHQSVRQARPVIPSEIINGQIKQPGETDYYSFRAKAGQELSFDVLQTQNCEVRFDLYRSGGSWLDPDRFTRVLLREDLPGLIRP